MVLLKNDGPDPPSVSPRELLAIVFVYAVKLRIVVSILLPASHRGLPPIPVNIIFWSSSAAALEKQGDREIVYLSRLTT